MRKRKRRITRLLREAVPDLERIATGREARPLEADRVAEAFSVAGEQQEDLADEETLFFAETAFL